MVFGVAKHLSIPLIVVFAGEEIDDTFDTQLRGESVALFPAFLNEISIFLIYKQNGTSNISLRLKF